MIYTPSVSWADALDVRATPANPLDARPAYSAIEAERQLDLDDETDAEVWAVLNGKEFRPLR